MSFWACARLHPSREFVAQRFVAMVGLSLYVPVVKTVTLQRGQKVARIEPLFRCYGFLRVESRWCDARSAPGVNHILMHGEVPAIVPDAIVDCIRRRERGGIVSLPKESPFERGEA